VAPSIRRPLDHVGRRAGRRRRSGVRLWAAVSTRGCAIRPAGRRRGARAPARVDQGSLVATLKEGHCRRNRGPARSGRPGGRWRSADRSRPVRRRTGGARATGASSRGTRIAGPDRRGAAALSISGCGIGPAGAAGGAPRGGASHPALGAPPHAYCETTSLSVGTRGGSAAPPRVADPRGSWR
jgi:hypothetical protein